MERYVGACFNDFSATADTPVLNARDSAPRTSVRAAQLQIAFSASSSGTLSIRVYDGASGGRKITLGAIVTPAALVTTFNVHPSCPYDFEFSATAKIHLQVHEVS